MLFMNAKSFLGEWKIGSHLQFFDKTGCNGDDNCCTSSIPCNEGEGDCDSDADCKSGLVCGHNNCSPKDSRESWNPIADELGLVNDCCVIPKDGTLVFTT